MLKMQVELSEYITSLSASIVAQKIASFNKAHTLGASIEGDNNSFSSREFRLSNPVKNYT